MQVLAPRLVRLYRLLLVHHKVLQQVYRRQLALLFRLPKVRLHLSLHLFRLLQAHLSHPVLVSHQVYPRRLVHPLVLVHHHPSLRRLH